MKSSVGKNAIGQTAFMVEDRAHCPMNKRQCQVDAIGRLEVVNYVSGSLSIELSETVSHKSGDRTNAIMITLSREDAEKLFRFIQQVVV